MKYHSYNTQHVEMVNSALFENSLIIITTKSIPKIYIRLYLYMEPIKFSWI